jgi:hypothetical protein
MHYYNKRQSGAPIVFKFSFGTTFARHMIMKKLLTLLLTSVVILTGCATVQSIIKSTFPYTSTLVIPASTKANSTASSTSAASSFDEIFGNQSGANYIKEVRIASARLDASNPGNKSLGMFKSVKLYISNGNSGETMVASRTDVQENIGTNLVLDIDNSKFLDNYIKGNSLKVRLEYVLRNANTSDVSVRAALSFTSAPNTQ